MDDIKILEAVEKYIRGEMNPDEILYFENLRKTNPEIDQLVVEHTLFLQQMNRFGERKKFKSSVHDVHTSLAVQGKISSARLKGKAKVVYLWRRYRRVAAIAAVIAGVTTLTISSLVLTLTPKTPTSEFDKLKGIVNEIDTKTKQQDKEINQVKSKINNQAKPIVYTTWGTGFIIDPKGYIVTNAHVIDGAKNIVAHNKLGDFSVTVIYKDAKKDVAILQITDDSFKPFSNIPYAISKSSVRLAESIFTLGFPKNDVVYGQGYLSSKSGFNGDTLSFQMDIPANWGNSGSPILNESGEVIGILNGRQSNTEGFSFAILSKNLFQVVDDMKKDTAYPKVKIASGSSISRLERSQQIEKIEDYIFMIKVN